VAARYEELGNEAFDDGRLVSAGGHFYTASAVYHFGKFVWVIDPVQARAASDAVVRCHERALGLIRFPGRKVRFAFDGAQLVGVLRTPEGTGPFPTVVLAPGLDSVKEELRSTEETLLVRGMATFTIDGPGQGETEWHLPIRGDWEVVAHAVIDVVQSFAEVDPDRIGVWGVSLGGYYSARMASGDERIRACVVLAGPYDFSTDFMQKPDLTKEAFRTRSGAKDVAEAFERSKALTLAGRTSGIRCPLYIVGGKLDRIIRWEEQQRLHDEVPGSEMLMLDDGNHGNTNLVAEHRPRTADWLARQLGADHGNR
jgi:2,6-dihydroxypseudooxynicotine hydrolase